MHDFPWLAGFRFTPVDVACGPGEVAAWLNGQFGEQVSPEALGASLTFVTAPEALSALAFEESCASGRIPTRDNLHDAYNGMVWLHLPRFKQALTLMHLSQQQHADAVGANGRTPVRDALTVLDESGAVLLCEDSALMLALTEHHWTELFMRRRSDWGRDCALVLLGHGLMEALQVLPHPGLCAKVLPVLVPRGQLGAMANDLAVLDDLLVQSVALVDRARGLSPLPVLGVPGWWALNEAPGFYDDARFFRAKPTVANQSSHQRLAFQWDGTTLRPWKRAGQPLPCANKGEESPDSSEQGAG